MMGYFADKLIEKTGIHLIKAVRLLDIYTQETVGSGVRIRAGSGIEVVHRPDGYCLFLYRGNTAIYSGAKAYAFNSRCGGERKSQSVSGKMIEQMSGLNSSSGKQKSQSVPMEVIEPVSGLNSSSGRQQSSVLLVQIESPIYQPLELCLYVDNGEEAEDIYLHPSSAYPAPPGSTIVQGHAPRGTTLYFHIPEGVENAGCRLMHDYAAGSMEISIFVRGRAKDGCRSWYAWNKERGNGEYFTLQKVQPDIQKYSLTAPLSGSCLKKDTVLYPAYTCTVDDRGEFYLLIAKLDAKAYSLYYAVFDGISQQEQRGKTDIIGMKANYLTIFAGC